MGVNASVWHETVLGRILRKMKTFFGPVVFTLITFVYTAALNCSFSLQQQRQKCNSLHTNKEETQKASTMPFITSNHFWSKDVEENVQAITVEFNTINLEGVQFVDVRLGCGRMKNRWAALILLSRVFRRNNFCVNLLNHILMSSYGLVIFCRLLITDNGVRYCARYRNNMEQLQGEVCSYFFGKLLNMHKNILTPLPVQVYKLLRMLTFSDAELSFFLPSGDALFSNVVSSVARIRTQRLAISNYCSFNSMD